MRFRKMNATFGTLERRTLTFSEGLNVIEAPNEAGKSTLSAFLRAMLYGLSTRERGALADKNRYLPWSGSPMQGTLELESEQFGAVTLQRDTARANSPMGRFSAVRTGTADEIPGLTAADCGEALLGVPREVYERSAFIRQSGLAVGADPELERRIAALITTGEEGAAYSDAAAALKKQLNARRSNARSGQIPALEREIAEGEAALGEMRALLREREEAEASLAALKEREAALREAIKKHELADRQQQFAAREQAKRDADGAAREARVFRRMLGDSGVPAREVLDESRSRLRTVEELERRRRAADSRRQDAELAVSQFDATPRPGALRAVAALWFLLLIISAAAVPAAAFLRFPLPPAALYGSVAGVVLFAVLFTLEWMRARQKKRLLAQERETLEAKLREAEASCAAIREASEQTLAQIFEAIPAGDQVSAAAYVHENLARWDMLAQMEAEAQAKRQRYEDLPRPDLKDVPAFPVERPAESREALQSELDRANERRAEARSRADYTSGRLRAIGDPGELEPALAEKRERLALAQEEYEALALAAETLESANAALQNRFSPELGERTAAYFSELTGGRYDAVALDRTFRALATESGESASRDASLLSQGASDQLYLAVRLAVCDMVLPKDRSIPLVLDDALVDFDDARCRAALELLLRTAAERQILLLTCQHREAAYLNGREHVHIFTL